MSSSASGSKGALHGYSKNDNRSSKLRTYFGKPLIPKIEQDEKPRPRGRRLEMKRFYESDKITKYGGTDWTEKQPQHQPLVHREEVADPAIHMYQVKDGAETYNGLPNYVTCSLHLQSLHILRTLGSILAKQDITVAENTSLKIEKPFKELYFAYPEILAIVEENDLGFMEREHLTLLLSVADEVWGSLVPEVTALIDQDMIDYERLWTLFPINIRVFSRLSGQDQIFEVVSCH